MQRRIVYSLGLLTILAIFGGLLLWPGFVIDNYVTLRQTLTEGNDQDKPVPPKTQDIVAGITFDIPTTTSSSSDAFSESDETEDRRLIIPSIGVNGEIIESNDQSALNRGFWHIPGSALPGENGNIVISSHRWLHVPPHPVTFYRIDEVNTGDPVQINYQGKRYTYEVTETKIVEPTEVSILEQNENKLTLFTCHPLFSTKQRYVVIAQLRSIHDIPPEE